MLHTPKTTNVFYIFKIILICNCKFRLYNKFKCCKVNIKYNIIYSNIYKFIILETDVLGEKSSVDRTLQRIYIYIRGIII
jgi:hypothetical protein